MTSLSLCPAERICPTLTNRRIATDAGRPIWCYASDDQQILESFIFIVYMSCTAPLLLEANKQILVIIEWVYIYIYIYLQLFALAA